MTQKQPNLVVNQSKHSKSGENNKLYYFQLEQKKKAASTSQNQTHKEHTYQEFSVGKDTLVMLLWKKKPSSEY